MHNLIINNDKKSSYVSFHVNIPDGYDKFKIDGLNGSIINQNYFNVGDRITVSFDNNPIRYDIPKGATATAILKNGTEISKAKDRTSYKYILTDFFKVHEIVFIPIYQIFDTQEKLSYYIYNPCDDKYFLTDLTEESKAKIPKAIYFHKLFNANFIGKFVIGLRNVPGNKIPDIDIIIGESINNSRKDIHDSNNYTLENSITNDITTQQLIASSYNYGSVWTNPIKNLIMKHVESLNVTFNEDLQDSFTALFALKIKNSDESYSYITKFRLPCTSYLILNSTGDALNFKNTITFKDFDGNDILDVTDGRIILSDSNILSSKQYPVYLKIDENNNFYTSDCYSRLKTAPYINGLDIGTGTYNLDESNNHFFITKDNNTLNDLSLEKFIDGTWNYSFYNIIFSVSVSDSYINNKHFHMIVPGNADAYKYTLVEVKLDGTEYSIYDLDNNVVIDHVTFMTYNFETGNFAPADISIFLIGDQYVNRQCFYYYLNSGIMEDVKFVNNKYQKELLNNLIQFTPDYDENEDNTYKLTSDIENIYISADGTEGLKLETLPLRNITHNLIINEDEDENIVTTLENKDLEFKMTNGGSTYTLPLKAFIPCRFRIPLQQYSTRYFMPDLSTYGWFIIRNSDLDTDSSLIDLNDFYETDVFINDGFETLDVQGVSNDDDKFKTFNGSIIYDRSNSMINKLTSNDITGLALDYLNDLLAAKLSHYYIPVSYNIWNSFILNSNELNITLDSNALSNQLLDSGSVQSGNHDIILSSCYDIVKIIGSENIVKNCLPSCVPERNYYNSNNLDVEDLFESYEEEDTYEDYKYYYFQYYDSGNNIYPSLDNNFNILNFRTICFTENISQEDVDISKNSVNFPAYNTLDVVNFKTFNGAIANNKIDFFNRYFSWYYLSSELVNNEVPIKDYGYSLSIPCYRIYKNSNFEQTDLTISTGGVKTLHPIYLQATPRILLNNLTYITDTILNKFISLYGSTGVAGNRMYMGTLAFQLMADTFNNNTLVDPSYNNLKFPLFRFLHTEFIIGNIGLCQSSISLDTFFLMNFLYSNTINDFQNLKEELAALPSETNVIAGTNEEIVKDLRTYSNSINIQLFSSKLFNFYDNIDTFAIVIFKQAFLEQMYGTDETSLRKYYDIDELKEDKERLVEIKNNINALINDTTSFNNLKNCKIFICKLGEFLQFPKILFLVSSQTFNNSLNVSVYNYNMNEYQDPFPEDYSTGTSSFVNNDKQKINTYYAGVLFKYHQLALGYQNLNNELYDEFIISNALGNRNFKLVLVDEYGRRIPNEDTSQGFINNLYLELTLSTIPKRSTNQPMQQA